MYKLHLSDHPATLAPQPQPELPGFVSIFVVSVDAPVFRHSESRVSPSSRPEIDVNRYPLNMYFLEPTNLSNTQPLSFHSAGLQFHSCWLLFSRHSQ